jgi:hypothetical protein
VCVLWFTLILWPSPGMHTIQADAFVFCFPTRFGTVAAQFKAFIDATGGRECCCHKNDWLLAVVPVLSWCI